MWEALLPGTFGTTDLIFSKHSRDIDQALTLIQACRKQGIPLNDVLHAAETYLTTQKATATHIDLQVKRITERLEHFLD